MSNFNSSNNEKIYYTYMESPVGRLLIAGSSAGIRIVAFPKGKKYKIKEDWEERPDEFDKAVSQLNDYFSGKLKKFSVKIDLHGTVFQKKVLNELQKVPYGETISYGELAKKAGSPKAGRAVGAVNAQNPVPIIIPCHRVIGKNGKLIGFGGGLDVKEKLLELEKKYLYEK